MGPIMEFMAQEADCSVFMVMVGPSFLRTLSAGDFRDFTSTESGYKVADIFRQAYNSRADRAPDKTPVYCPWPEEISSLPDKAKTLDENLKQLIEIIELYEEFGPPHGNCGMFGKFDVPASPHLPRIPLPPHRLSAYIKDPLPPQFWDLKHLLHSAWHPVTFFGWIHQQHFLDPETKVMWGGKGGIRWIVLPLIRMALQTAQKKRHTENEKNEPGPEFMDCLGLYVESCCNVVIKHVQGSIAILSKANRPRQEVSEDQMSYGDPPVAYKRQGAEEPEEEPEEELVTPSPTKSFRFKSPLEEGSSANISIDEVWLQSLRKAAGRAPPTRSILKRTRPTPNSSPSQPSTSKRLRPGLILLPKSSGQDEFDDSLPLKRSSGRGSTFTGKGKEKEEELNTEDEYEEEEEELVAAPPTRTRASPRRLYARKTPPC